MNDQSTTQPITDSLWFWLLLFSSIAVVALLVIGGKYVKRQAGIERKYQARERLAQQATSGAPLASSTAEGGGYSQPGRNLIPLWPLAIVLAVVALVSGVMLTRSRAQSCDSS